MKRLLALLLSMMLLISCAVAENAADDTTPPPFFPQLRLEDMLLCEGATSIEDYDPKTGELAYTIVYDGPSQGSSSIVCYYDVNGDLMQYDLRSREDGIKFVSYDLYGNMLFGWIMTPRNVEYTWRHFDQCWTDADDNPLEELPKGVHLDDLPPILVLEAPAEEAPEAETADEAAE